MNSKQKGRKYDIIFIICLIGIIAVFLNRINLGLADKDETFYLGIPYRMTRGDGLLADEWHLSQLVGFLIYPIMKVYMWIMGTTEGIVLNFRYIYLIIHIISVFLTYFILKKKDKFLAFCIATMYGLFTPYGIMQLCYNYLGLLSVFGISVISTSKFKHKRIAYLVVGVLLAATVLCNPYFVSVYVIYFMAVFFSNLCKKKAEEYFSWEAFGFVTLGVAILACLFFIEVFSKATWKEVLFTISHLAKGDAEHSSKSINSFLLPMIRFVVEYKVYFIILIVSVTIGFLIPKLQNVCISLFSMISMGMVIYFAFIEAQGNGIGYNAIMLPLSLVGLEAFLFVKDKDWSVFIKGWLLGLLYAMCMNMSSNQGMYVISNALTVSSCMSLFFIKGYYQENCVNKNTWKICLTVIIGIQLCSEVQVQRTHIFWEENIADLKYPITQGPLKGLYTTKEKKDYYDITCRDINALGDLKGKSILFFPILPYGYYMTDAEMAASSAWTMSSNDFLYTDGLLKYYEIYEEKIPDIIFIDSRSTAFWDSKQWEKYCDNEGYSLETYPSGAYVLRKK